jgi:phosphoserine phosphatase
MPLQHHPAIKTLLEQASTFPKHTRPLAVFDCDGTVIKGDIGEAMFFRQIEEFMFRVSPADLWLDYPYRHELEEAYRELLNLAPHKRAAHPAFEAFAGYLVCWYYEQLAEGKVAKACSDIVRLFAGCSLAEVREFAAHTLKHELQVPLGGKQLGRRTVHSGIRFLRESVELVRLLQEHHFDIWAVSGSSVWSVEPVFQALGVSAEQVIGISLESSDGILTGTAVEPVPIREDKISALKARDTRIPHLVASDSRNDIPLLLYSSGVKVWVNSRQRTSAEFFAAVGSKPDAQWLVIEEPTILHHN